MSNNSAKKFQDLLVNYSQAEDLELRQHIEAQLWDEYGMESAVFVLDMSGFSLLTRKYGIVHYLIHGQAHAIDHRADHQIF